MGDKYVIHGQAGAVGRKARAEANTFQQYQAAAEAFDLARLAEELAKLRDTLPKEASEPAHYRALAEVSEAEEAARQGKGAEALKRLKAAGQWSFEVATKIGTSVAAKAIQAGMGL